MKNKLLIFSLKFLLVGVLFLYLMDTTGTVSLIWKQWHITTSLNIVLVGIFGFFFTVMTIRWIKNKIWSFLNLSEANRLKELKKGMLLLERALTQDYLGSREQKIENLKKAKKLLPDSNLPKLLMGCEKGNEIPTMSALQDHGALKTLITIRQYQKENNLEALGNFFQNPPEAFLKEGWLWRETFFYWKKIQHWQDAKMALEKGLEYQGFSDDEGRCERAVLLFHLALEEDNPLKQLDLFHQAYALDPDNTENTVAYARALYKQEERRLAKKVLTKSWKLEPTALIAEIYIFLFAKDKTPTAVMHAMRELYQLNPSSVISQYTFIISLLQTKLWAEASLVIDKLDQGPEKALFQILLEMKEKKEDKVSLSSFKNFVHQLISSRKVSHISTDFLDHVV